MPVDIRKYLQTPRALIEVVGLFAFLVIAISAIAFRYHIAQRDAIEREVRHEVLAIADIKATQIGEWRRERLDDGRLIAAAVPEIPRRFLSGSHTRTDEEAARRWLETLKSRAYSGAALTDSAGNVVLSIGGVAADPGQIKELAQDTLRTGELSISDFSLSAAGRAYLALLVPLRATPASAPFGVVSLYVDPATYIYGITRRKNRVR
jgi:hypothetical protein